MGKVEFKSLAGQNQEDGLPVVLDSHYAQKEERSMKGHDFGCCIASVVSLN